MSLQTSFCHFIFEKLGVNQLVPRLPDLAGGEEAPLPGGGGEDAQSQGKEKKGLSRSRLREGQGGGGGKRKMESILHVRQ